MRYKNLTTCLMLALALALLLALSGTAVAQEPEPASDGSAPDGVTETLERTADVMTTETGTVIEFGNPPDKGNGNCFPFCCAGSPGTRYQQVYNASMFPEPVHIDKVQFFNTQMPGASFYEADYEIRLSTTSKSVNGLDIGNMSNNVGPDDAFFYGAHLSGPTDTVVTFDGFDFPYDPGLGNLLIDVQRSNLTGSGRTYLDARNGSFGSDSSRAHNYGSAFASWGLRTAFVVYVNRPPVAVCQGAVVAVGEVPDIDGGSSDPDGDKLIYTQFPEGAFTEAGIYQVTLTVTDPYGETDSCTAQVVVYDPSAGFVTGGGWFNQPDPIIDSCNGNYYELVDAAGISWADAAEAASAMTLGVMGEVTGHLVTITSQGEQECLFALFDGSLHGMWYGGFQDPDEVVPAAGWQWVTGEPWDYTNWSDLEPNDNYGEASEQHLLGWSGGVDWNDEGNLGNVNGYVVEYEGSDLLTGKAVFGFVSKYKKGANAPTGQTEFQFHAGGLNFHSSSYDWLVVTGSDYARFKGTGTINGSGNYKFMLWAGDAPDTFRIKIWWEDDDDAEHVVYDNGMDQLIGGSIVVHAK